MASRRSPGLRRLAYYRAHFLETVRPGGVVCLKCGKERKMLGTHILIAGHKNLLMVRRNSRQGGCKPTWYR